jgi:hypothetical protein
MDRDVGVGALAKRHAERLADWVAQHPDVTIVPVASLADFCATETALRRHANQHRQSVGFLTPDELCQMAASLGQAQRADRVAALLEQIRAEILKRSKYATSKD